MEELIPQLTRKLCRLDELPDGGSKGFPPPLGKVAGVFLVRRQGMVYGYVNACPHIGTPLDWVPGRFLSVDSSRIICATHGAEFQITDGTCTRGPCRGTGLTPILIQVNDGMIFMVEASS